MTGRSGATAHEAPLQTHRHRLRRDLEPARRAAPDQRRQDRARRAPVGPDGVAQVVCHLDGVGTGRGTGRVAQAIDRALGGALGGGLLATLADAYRFLVFAYAPGDEIYLFGYSRGAYTARSLAGLIRNCGILERRHADALPAALALYRGRTPDTGPDSPAALAFRAARAAHVTVGRREAAWRAERGLPAGTPVGLAYIGVWDTVGALGVPSDLGIARWLNRGLSFHDTALAKTVAAARHAVAIDERRRTFPPTLWDNLEALNAATAGRPYAQHWFPGDHGSVGGGGAVTALSDDALAWVADGAAAAGLALDPEALAAWRAGRDWRGPLAARWSGPLQLWRRVLALGRPRPRGAGPGRRPRPLRDPPLAGGSPLPSGRPCAHREQPRRRVDAGRIELRHARIVVSRGRRREHRRPRRRRRAARLPSDFAGVSPPAPGVGVGLAPCILTVTPVNKNC